MGKIYKGQTKLLINVSLDSDLSNASDVKLKYEKPNGETGQFSTTVLTASTGDIQFEVTSASDLDVVGKWTFWGYVTYNDSKVAMGEPFTIKIYQEGT